MWEEDYIPHQVLNQVPLWEHEYVTSQLLQAVPQRERKTTAELLADGLEGRPKGKGRLGHGAISEIPVAVDTITTFGSNTSEPLEDCTILVVRLRGMYAEGCKNATALDAQYAAKGLRRAYALIGEEERGCMRCQSLVESAPLIIRNYWHEDCDEYEKKGKVVTVPLGVRSPGKAARFEQGRPASQRPYIWAFSSREENPQRAEMVKRFMDHKFVGETESNVKVWYPGQLKDKGYNEWLCNSKFALVPKGHVEDTWRLAESVNCGAIPIVTDEGAYFSHFMPRDLTKRFITVGDTVNMTDKQWDSLFAEVDALLSDPSAMDQRQDALIHAFEAHTLAWQSKVAERLRAVGQ